MTIKTVTPGRRLATAVLAGAIAFTSFGFTAPAFADTGATIEAGTYAETIVTTGALEWTPGYGETEASVSLTDSIGYDHKFTGENITAVIGHTSVFRFTVKLTDQPQIISQLVAKHIDGLIGADKLVTLENPLVVPAFKPWPEPVLDDRIVLPAVDSWVDAQGYTRFRLDDSKIGTTTTDLSTADRVEVWIDGKQVTNALPTYKFGEVCDYPASTFNGKKLSIRAYYTLDADGTSRYGETTFDCAAFIPLRVKLSQEVTTANPGEVVAFKIDELAGTYGKDAVIAWEVDGKAVDGATGTGFTAPDAFTVIKATVTATDREGETLTRSVGWAHFVDATKPDAPAPGEDSTPKPDAGTAPVKDADKTPAKDKGKDPAIKDKIADTDDADSDDQPLKSECEDLCSDAKDDAKKISTGIPHGSFGKPQGTLVKPAVKNPKPGVMSNLSTAQIAQLNS